MKGPKNKYWTDFVNHLLQELDLDGYFFNSAPFPTSTTRDSTQELAFKGSTSFAVSKCNPVFGKLKELLAIGDDVNQLEITVKPKQQLTTSADAIATNLSDAGLEKYVMRGKMEAEDALTDLYIVGTGHVSDSLKEKSEISICQEIKNKVGANRTLQSLVEVYSNDGNYSQQDIELLTNLRDNTAWRDIL